MDLDYQPGVQHDYCIYHSQLVERQKKVEEVIEKDREWKNTIQNQMQNLIKSNEDQVESIKALVEQHNQYAQNYVTRADCERKVEKSERAMESAERDSRDEDKYLREMIDNKLKSFSDSITKSVQITLTVFSIVIGLITFIINLLT